MATTAPSSVTKLGGDDSVVKVTYTIANGNDGTPCEYAQWADRSVHVAGTFGVGGTIVIEGSNNGSTYKTLTDPQGNALSFTAESIEAITELVRYIRPRVTAGDGTTAITVDFLFRRPQQLRV